MSVQSCIFCRIVAGEIPAQKVYEDELCLAFHDLNPQAPVHVLVIPREHIASLSHAKPEQGGVLGHLMLTAARIATETNIEQTGYRTVINTGEHGGQSVFHIHVHVLGGRQMTWGPG